ncbi:hypothetical protein DSO57_1001905 [Entomophthora muscae]|uniref:Uncharacterized protein n=1 Tax=Entomophthora muscae TaxID=34485 RepID=A0ACC2UIG4_9FUNG|nr:hypothetical protein DSO57_1001905 [Entomophthora muscae]
MTPPLTLQPNRPMEPPTAAKTTSTQLFGVLYITLTVMVDSMVPNSGPWSLLGQSVSYIIKLAPILWWALSTGLAVLRPKATNASTYAWLPDTELKDQVLEVVLLLRLRTLRLTHWRSFLAPQPYIGLCLFIWVPR